MWAQTPDLTLLLRKCIRDLRQRFQRICGHASTALQVPETHQAIQDSPRSCRSTVSGCASTLICFFSSNLGATQ